MTSQIGGLVNILWLAHLPGRVAMTAQTGGLVTGTSLQELMELLQRPIVSEGLMNLKARAKLRAIAMTAQTGGLVTSDNWRLASML